MGELVKPEKKLPKGLPSSKYIITEYLTEQGFNPAQKYLELYERAEELYDEAESTSEKVAAMSLQKGILKDIMPYYTPQLKSVDVNVNTTEHNELTVNVIHFEGLLKNQPKVIEVTADE